MQLTGMNRTSVWFLLIATLSWNYAAQAAVTKVKSYSLKKLGAEAAPAAAAPAAAAPAAAAPAVKKDTEDDTKEAVKEAEEEAEKDEEESKKPEKKVKKGKEAVAAKTTKQDKKSANAEDDDEDDEDETPEEKAEDAKEDAEEAALKKDVKVAKAALQQNVEERKRLQTELAHLQDTKASDMEIDANIKLVSKETESKALAGMMGNMWKEMRQFEVPEYAPFAKEEITSMTAKEAGLKANLAKAQARLDAKEKEWAAEDKEDEDEDANEEKTIKNAAPSAKLPKVKVENEVDTPSFPPIPTTARCIVIMVIQYMIVYTALALCRTWHEFRGTPKGKLVTGLQSAAQTLTYGPMLCVLFIACRMRVEFLSDGKDQPQWWVQNCMYALTFAVLASALCCLCMPMITGVNKCCLKEDHHELEAPDLAEWDSKAAFYTLSTVRYLILLGLYGGLAGVIVGTCIYMPPGVTDRTEIPSPSAAVSCTMILAVLFFATQLVIALCRSYTEFTGVQLPKVLGMMLGAENAVEFAPQLSILFLAARMRALQHHGQPESWVQTCMYSCTVALCLTAVLACLVPLMMNGTVKTNPATRETTFEVPHPTTGLCLIALRFMCLFYLYGGACGIAYSIFVYESPEGPEHTRPVSPTVRCIINLSCQFFFVYLLQTIMLTISEMSGKQVELQKYRLFGALEAAKTSLAMAPMLSILFVTTRMYALLITDRKGSPQAWVQDGMYMATWALFISFMSCLATGLVNDEVKTDEDGNVINKFSNRYVAVAMLVVRYLAMLLLYGGIVMVVTGLFLMTPETANGRGSVINMAPPPNAHDVVGAVHEPEAPAEPTLHQPNGFKF